MNDNQQSNGFGGGKNKQSFNGQDYGRPNTGRQNFQHSGNKEGGRTQMFAATCADCHKQCEVPFRPVGDKPVYCKECFNKRRESAPRDAGYKDSDSRSGNFPKQNFVSAKPQSSGPQLDDLKWQMDAMNAKLDTLIQKLKGAGPKARKPVVKKTVAKNPRKATKSSKK